MMMAHDSSPDRPELNPETVAELTSALHRYAANQTDIDGIQPALGALATEARKRKVHAEQLLVVLKDAWFGLPAVRDAGDPEQRQRQLQRLVTLCIREYYS